MDAPGVGRRRSAVAAPDTSRPPRHLSWAGAPLAALSVPPGAGSVPAETAPWGREPCSGGRAGCRRSRGRRACVARSASRLRAGGQRRGGAGDEWLRGALAETRRRLPGLAGTVSAARPRAQWQWRPSSGLGPGGAAGVRARQGRRREERAAAGGGARRGCVRARGASATRSRILSRAAPTFIGPPAPRAHPSARGPRRPNLPEWAASPARVAVRVVPPRRAHAGVGIENRRVGACDGGDRTTLSLRKTSDRNSSTSSTTPNSRCQSRDAAPDPSVEWCRRTRPDPEVPFRPPSRRG